jgi:hypothetical protein
VKKIGFIAEGDSEVIFLNSSAFQSTLQSLGFRCVGVYNLNGRDNFWGQNQNLISFIQILIDSGAEDIIFLLDFEFDNCYSQIKERIGQHFHKQHIVIAKRAIEAWFLSDSITLSSIFNNQFNLKNPENTKRLPLDILREEHFNNCGYGLGKSKPRCATKIINAGFTIEGACQNSNCQSAAYFLKKLKDLSE